MSEFILTGGKPPKEIIPRSFKERQEYYAERWSGIYPYSWKRHYNQIIAIFKLLQFSKIRTVVELGCNDGALAVQTLTEVEYPLWWTGYDFIEAPIKRSKTHPHYKPYLLDRWLWEMDDVQPFDVFLSSHTIEHIYPEDVEALVDWLSPRAKYLIVAAPMGRLSTQQSKKQYMHIMNEGYIWMSDVLHKHGFKSIWETGRWFGWFKKQ